MKKLYRFLLLALPLMATPYASQAYITVSGDVSGQSWVNTETYYVSGAITVNNGSTLEIQEGTVIKFAVKTYLFV